MATRSWSCALSALELVPGQLAEGVRDLPQAGSGTGGEVVSGMPQVPG
jgi:hypothetical protein